MGADGDYSTLTHPTVGDAEEAESASSRALARPKESDRERPRATESDRERQRATGRQRHKDGERERREGEKEVKTEKDKQVCLTNLTYEAEQVFTVEKLWSINNQN